MVKTVVEFTNSAKGELEAQKESETPNSEEKNGDSGMAREQSYLDNSDLNSVLTEDKNYRGFNDSLKSMFVRHKRCETPSVSKEWKPQRRPH